MHSLNSPSLFDFIVVFRPVLQQPVGDFRMQERRSVRHQQEEPNFVQSLSIAQVSPRRNVQKWITIRSTIQLVQIALPDARTRTCDSLITITGFE